MTLAITGGTPLRTRPFPAWPQYGKPEEDALLNVLHSGSWGGYQDAVKQLEAGFAQYHQVPHGISCSNGTVALQVALHAIGVGPGDEVIVPPFTFVASASAVLLCGASPVFADIDPDTFNLSVAAAEAAITSRTKAIVVVHFGGRPAEMDAFRTLAQQRGLMLLEDAAHAHGARWMGTPVGGWGDVATFSFQAFKLMTAGEGGMILTRSPQVADACWAFCNQGRKRDAGWFEHYTLGTNYRLTAFQAAVLNAQLERLPQQTRTRAANAAWLKEQLSDIPGLTLPPDDPRIEQEPHYLLTFWYDPEAFEGAPREVFIAAMQAEGIPVKPTYPQPLYRNPLFAHVFQAQNYHQLHLPVAERVCREGIWLGQTALLGDKSDVDDIVAAVRKIRQFAPLLAASTVAAGRR
jgi:dTDP-4-amino-4,6-dideoxygalactose transaminase